MASMVTTRLGWKRQTEGAKPEAREKVSMGLFTRARLLEGPLNARRSHRSAPTGGKDLLSVQHLTKRRVRLAPSFKAGLAEARTGRNGYTGGVASLVFEQGAAPSKSL
jgi:hypothetical protein